MNKYVGLIITDSSNSTFKSKNPAESHKILGQSILQWSGSALADTVDETQSILCDDISKGKEFIGNSEQFLINWGDQPLILAGTFQHLLEKHSSEGSDATAMVSYNGKASVYVFSSKAFLKRLSELGIQSLSRFYIDQIFQTFQNRIKITSEDKNQFVVVDDRVALSAATKEIKSVILEKIMLSGVTIIDPSSTFIDAGVVIGEDTTIMPNTIIEGDTVIGECSVIGPGSRIVSCRIGNNVDVANSVAYESSIGDETHVGPFAYLRPGSNIGRNVKIGDFVEIKKSVIGDRTKISHLTYVGDAEVGSNVNIGCGVVFVNYDGKNKNKTTVGDNSFIGCNVNLVSPVVVKNDAYIAAGSTITDEVPENSLAIARERQVIKQDWVTKKDLKRR
jgi:bifunctional UDP-N-acetylglucosamine pyrophosphorylase/glucosamine-1-phosphate N-acetyltransferase